MKGRILVLDDSDTFERELAAVLESRYEVVLVKNSADALALCEHWLPDILVLDIENTDSGLLACQLLAEEFDVPIIFAVRNDSLATQLEAFEAGACDVLPKPVAPQTLLHKANLAIHNRKKHLALEKQGRHLQSMAMGFLSSLGENGILMTFVRSSIQCKTYQELAEKLVDSANELGIACFGEIRCGAGESVRFRTDGEATALEQSVISQLSTMGRVFQFRSQLIVNFPQVSIVAHGLPTDADDKVGRVRDNLAVLAETADALCENVQTRQNAGVHAESLQLALMQANVAAMSLKQEMTQVLLDTRLLLQELEDNVNRAHSWLGTTADQESAISTMMDDSIQRIIATISSTSMEGHLDRLLATMTMNHGDDDLELF